MKITDVLLNQPKLLFSRNNMRAVFCDIYENDMIRINTLLAAYDEGIVAWIDHNQDSGNRISQFVTRLVDNHGIAKEPARSSVKTWIDILNPEVLAAYRHEIELNQIKQTDYVKSKRNTVKPQKENADSSTFSLKNDIYNVFINPSVKLQQDRIFIPCGFGNSDLGFYICGIRKEDICKHSRSSIFALVYNILIRNTRMNPSDIIRSLPSDNNTFDADVRGIYRTAILILQLVKNNYAKDSTLNISYFGDKSNLLSACVLINHYLALFSKLAHIPTVVLNVNNTHEGIPVYMNESKGVYIEDNTGAYSIARELWYGPKINYQLSEDNLKDLEALLSEISPYSSFRDGQFEVLAKMVSADRHQICIMPTGSGKSLIYYMISFLQPLPLFIIAPTDILIRDQIRNLRLTHKVDNIAHIQLTQANDLRCWEMANSLNYITPTTLQCRNILMAFRYFNKGAVERHENVIRKHVLSSGPLFSYVILDEIHCLSHWGHDFRPEYLMLSRYLTRYLDQITYLGFTATADFTVIEDIRKQLSISQECILSPISLEKHNISYDFRRLSSDDDMYSTVSAIVQRMCSRNERTIVFTKSDHISRKVADAIGYEADVFSRDNDAYEHFADGKCKVLVANDDIGIGINLPDIKNIIHFGLPLSKSEYVQEIGRAGRGNEFIRSYVLYLSSDQAPIGFLRRDIHLDTLSESFQGYDNDYSDTYYKLTNGHLSVNELYRSLKSIYNSFESNIGTFDVLTYKFSLLSEERRKLYMLYVIGYIHDWYTYRLSENGLGIDIAIDIRSTDPCYDGLLNRMKKRTRDYFADMENDRESIAKCDRSSTPEQIIRIYVEWYYKKYLYHQKEQFLDLYDLISNRPANDEEITESIKDFFTLHFIRLKQEGESFAAMSVSQLLDKVVGGTGKDTITNIERINTNLYSYKLDYYLFCARLRYYGIFEVDRLNRLTAYLSDEEKKIAEIGFIKLYRLTSTSARMEIINYLASNENLFELTIDDLVRAVYEEEPKDIVYFGIIARSINHLFDERRKGSYV